MIIKKYSLLIILSFCIAITEIIFAMEPKAPVKLTHNSYSTHTTNHKNIDPIPKINKSVKVTHIKAMPSQQIKASAAKKSLPTPPQKLLPPEHTITSNKNVQDPLLHTSEKISPIIQEQKLSASKELKRTKSQELLLQENDIASKLEVRDPILNKLKPKAPIIPLQELAKIETFAPEKSTELLLQENVISPKRNRQPRTLDLAKTTSKAVTQSDTSHSIKQSKQATLRALQPKSHEIILDDPTVHEEIIDKFVTYVNKRVFSLIKKSFYVSTNMRVLQITFAEIIADTLKSALFKMSGISEHLATTRNNNNLNNFNMQIQYVAQQIQKYNAQTIYTSPEDMLLLIKFIHQFLKENNVVSFSQAMFIKLDTILKTAESCCYAIKNENMIFSSSNAPKSILSFFRPVIDSTNNLPNIKFSYDLMHAIYNPNGYTDQILQTWQKFQYSELYKTPANRQYGAFLTFLLIFETSIIAAAIILNETSTLYKITNPVPVVINIT